MEGNPLRPSPRNVEERQESEYVNMGSLTKGWVLAKISDIKPLTFLHEIAYFHVFCYQPYGSDMNHGILISTRDFSSQNRTFVIRLSSGQPPGYPIARTEKLYGLNRCD